MSRARTKGGREGTVRKEGKGQEGRKRKGREGRRKKHSLLQPALAESRETKNDVMGLGGKNVLWECHYSVFISV